MVGITQEKHVYFYSALLKKDNLPTNYLKKPEKKKLRLLLVNNREQ